MCLARKRALPSARHTRKHVRAHAQHKHTRTRMLTHALTQKHTDSDAGARARTHAHTHARKNTHTSTHVHMLSHTHTHTHERTLKHTRAHASKRTGKHDSVRHTHTCKVFTLRIHFGPRPLLWLVQACSSTWLEEAMPSRTESIHPLSMSFDNERKAVVLRTVHKLSFQQITEKLKNRKGGKPSKELVRKTVKLFDTRTGSRKFQYKKCGRKPWKVNDDVTKFLVARLKALRLKCVCTSTTLQRELAARKAKKLACSTIRKILFKAGYRWLRRAQKPKLSQERMAARKQFCQRVINMGPARLAKEMALSMDGAIFSIPPKDAVDRANFCSVGDSHMYRKPSESASPELAANDEYGKQVPLSRAVALWGGISPGGFSVLKFHPTKKIQPDEWVCAVESGFVTAAIKNGTPTKATGPWRVLCDNEGFLHASDSKKAQRKEKTNLWHVPPRSPDINVIEKYWSWLRRELRKRDLADLVQKRPPLGKMAYRQRILAICRTPKSNQVAANIYKSFMKVCKQVVKAKGARIRG